MQNGKQKHNQATFKLETAPFARFGEDEVDKFKAKFHPCIAQCSRSVSKIHLRYQWHMKFWGKSYQNIKLKKTRSRPKIPAAGYLEEEIFLDLKNLSFGLIVFKMALKVHNGK